MTKKKTTFYVFLKRFVPVLLSILVLVFGTSSGTAYVAPAATTTIYLPTIMTDIWTNSTTFIIMPEEGSTPTDIRIRFPFEFSDIRGMTNNPCTPGYDNIQGSGEIRMRVQIHVDDEGQVHLQGHMNLFGVGYDRNGVMYHMMDSFNSNLKTGLPFSFIDNFKMISQGNTDNFIVNFHLHIAPDLTATYNVAGPLCRG